MIEPYRTIVARLRNIVDCDQPGSCGVFAVLAVRALLKRGSTDFVVVFGWVNDGGIKKDHIWIELLTGEKIDPTFHQFGPTAVYLSRRRSYAPQAFANRRGFRMTESATPGWIKSFLRQRQ